MVNARGLDAGKEGGASSGKSDVPTRRSEEPAMNQVGQKPSTPMHRALGSRLRGGKEKISPIKELPYAGG
jgi:hypothetical protein